MPKRLSSVAAGAIVSTAILAGCAGTGAGSDRVGPPINPQTFAQLAAHSPTSLTPTLFLADLNANVELYSANIHELNPPQIGQITQGLTRTEDAVIDSKGVLYVMNGPSSPSIVEFKRGSKSPFRIITSGISYPGSIAVDAAQNLYLSMFNNHSRPIVKYYPAGKTSPVKIIRFPAEAGGLSLALDSKGNLYGASFDVEHQVARVYRVTRGSSFGVDLQLQNLPGNSIGLDGEDNIYVGGHGGTIEVYAPNGKTPSRTISANDNEFYSGFAVTKNGTIYWPSFDGLMWEFAPGASGPTNTFRVEFSGISAAVGVW